MYRFIRPLFFALSPHTAHAAGSAALAPLEYCAPLRNLVRAYCLPKDARLRTEAMGVTFLSPVGLAGGFDKNAVRARALGALGFGFLELGTVTAQAQQENARPNLFRLPQDRALINRLGFPNEGAARVAKRVAARQIASVGDVPIALSIGKSRSVPVESMGDVIADYSASLRAVLPHGRFVVVNVSSPNTANLRTMQRQEHASVLLNELSAIAGAVPLLLKIAPDLTDGELEALLEAVDSAKIAGVVATNTTLSRANLRSSASLVEQIGAGGLSGPPLFERARAIVSRCRRRLGPRATIVGVGGIGTAEEAFSMIAAGANLVQLYTSFIYHGPLTARQLSRDLSAIVEREGGRNIAEFVGTKMW